MKRKSTYIIIKLKDKLRGHWIEIQIDPDNSSTVWMDGDKVDPDTVIAFLLNNIDNQPDAPDSPFRSAVMQWVLNNLNDIVIKLEKIIDFGMEVQRRHVGGNFDLIIEDLTVAKEKIKSAVDAGTRGHGFQHKDHTRLPPWVAKDLKNKSHGPQPLSSTQASG